MEAKDGSPVSISPGPAGGFGSQHVPRPLSLHWLWPILLITLLVYLPSLDNGFTNWDDDRLVLENPLLTRPGLWEVLTTPVFGNYHPLTIASLLLDHRIHGFAPSGYHVTNLLLHLGNTALVFFFLRALSGGAIWTTLLASLFFGIHPMHVESVAWIAERKDVLYAAFYLGGLLLYLRYLRSQRKRWLLLTGLAFLGSLASKPAAVVFPLTLVLLDLYSGRPAKGRALWEKIPFLVLSLAAGALTLAAQRTLGAWSPSTVWSPFERVLFAAYAAVQYLWKAVVPIGLSAIYPYPRPGEGLEAKYALSLLAFVAIAVAVTLLARRSRLAAFGVSFFLVNIVLVLQLIPFGNAILADRFTYLPYVGLFVALACWLDERPHFRRFPYRQILGTGLLLLIPFAAYQTWNRCETWTDSETLWSDVIARHPESVPFAYNNRGHYYQHEAGRLEDALADFDRALAIEPTYARAWNNKGLALATLGAADSARACFDRAVAHDSSLVQTWNNRGVLKLTAGEIEDAIEDLSRSLALDAGYRDAYVNRANAYYQLGDFERMADDCRRVLELTPRDPVPYVHYGMLGFALQQLHRPAEAVPFLDEAIRAAPEGEPRLGTYYLSRSVARYELGRIAEATEDARSAIRLGLPIDPSYRALLGL